jgi:hypothetical protein
VLGASNIVSSVNDGLTLTVLPPAAPVITSANRASFAIGRSNSFTISASGSFNPRLFESNLAGSASGLPVGVSFHDNGNGTATLSGVPAIGTAGKYKLIIGAANGVTSGTVAKLVITVGPPAAPTFTSATEASFPIGNQNFFTITTSGAPTPNLFESDLGGDASGLPGGVLFHDNGDGTATLSGIPAAGTAGTYYVILGAFNGTGAVQGFTLTVM